MAKFINLFKEHRRGKLAMEVKGSVMRTDYPTMDDIRVLFTFLELADQQTFKWQDLSKISLNITEVFEMLSTMLIINKDKAPDYKYWKAYHPNNGVNKNLNLVKKGKYILLLYNDGTNNVHISFEVGHLVSLFMEKVHLLIYRELINGSNQ